jgi:hypothetical protein
VLGPPPDLIAKESYPYLSVTGCCLWVLLLAVYSQVATRVAARTISLPSARASAGISIGAFLVSCAYIAVVHPFFMLTIMLPRFGPRFGIFIEKHLPPLDYLYFHWGFQAHLPWWPFGHLAVIAAYLFAVLGMMHLPRKDDRALRDPSAN